MKTLKSFVRFIQELITRRDIILQLAKQDFKSKYLGSHLGILWAFIHPSIYIMILWFVFQVGFRSQPESNHPFILWMLAGIVPWFFFSDCLASATNSLIENSFLIKKMAFSIGILPIIKIVSTLMLHIFFLTIMLIVFCWYGYKPNYYNLQIAYYLFSSIILLLGLSWLTSSLVIFYRDISQLVSMLLQFAFWITPIFWSTKMLPKRYEFIIKLNPLYYIVQGYRDSFLKKSWFFDDNIYMSLYFWIVTCSILLIGSTVFRRLRPHMVDML